MKKLACFLLLLWVFFSVGCNGSSSGSGASEPQTLQIGVLLPVTGDSPINGAAQRVAVELAVGDINTYFAGNNSLTRVEAIISDTQGEIDEESRLLDAMCDQGIPIVVCSMTSGSLALVKSQIDANGTIILNEVSTSPYLSIDDNLFRLVPDDTYSARVMADLLWENGIEHIIFYYRDDWWGTALQEELTAAFTAKGGVVIDSIVYSSRAYDIDMDEKVEALNTAVTQALDTDRIDADKVAVALICFEEGIDILKKASAYPVLSTVQWYTGDGLGQNDDLLEDDTAAAFAVEVSLSAPLIAEIDSAAYRELQTRLQEETGLAHYAFAPVMYDAIWLAALTLAEAGSTADSALLKTTLLAEAAEYEAVTGIIDFNGSGDRSTCAYDFWTVELTDGAYQWVKGVEAYFSASAAPARPSASCSIPVTPADTAILTEPTEGEFLETINR